MPWIQCTGAARMYINKDLYIYFIYVRVTVCVSHFYIKYHKIIWSESFFKWCHSDIATRIPKQYSILQDKVWFIWIHMIHMSLFFIFPVFGISPENYPHPSHTDICRVKVLPAAARHRKSRQWRCRKAHDEGRATRPAASFDVSGPGSRPADCWTGESIHWVHQSKKPKHNYFGYGIMVLGEMQCFTNLHNPSNSIKFAASF